MDKHNWLVYSPSKDVVYCKVCAIFGATESDQNSSKLDRLVKSPITFWTTACEKLYDHALKSAVHKTATIKAENFVKIMKAEQSSIDTQLNTAVAQTIVKNKEKLDSIIKTILFCGHQNIALRGHKEGNNSNNPGNFRALLDIRVNSGDDVLAQHFSSAPKNAQYT